MRRLTLLTALAAAALFAFAAAASAAPSTYFPSYPSAGSIYQQEPRSVKLHSGAGWELDAWQGWGRAQAVTHGRFLARPDVVEGGADERGTVTLSRRVRCGTARAYTRMTAVLDSGRTDTPATDPIAIRPRCAPVFPTLLATLAPGQWDEAAPTGRPRRIVLGKTYALEDIRWTSWGGRIARGRAIASRSEWCANDPGRFCSRSRRVTVRLTRQRWCGERRLYHRLAVRGGGGLLPSSRADAGFLCPF